MEKVNVTLVLYFEIRDAEIYGGVGEIGYAKQMLDFETDYLKDVKLSEAAEMSIQGFAELCKVPVENVKIISRQEYEDNVEE